MCMDKMGTKILIVDDKVGLLKMQERRWYIDVIVQKNDERKTTQKILHKNKKTSWRKQDKY